LFISFLTQQHNGQLDGLHKEALNMPHDNKSKGRTKMSRKQTGTNNLLKKQS